MKKSILFFGLLVITVFLFTGIGVAQNNPVTTDELGKLLIGETEQINGTISEIDLEAPHSSLTLTLEDEAFIPDLLLYAVGSRSSGRQLRCLIRS